MPAHAILAEEITGAELKSGLFGQRFEVTHSGVDSTSPFVLFGSGDGRLIAAIQQIAAAKRPAPDDEVSTELSPADQPESPFVGDRPPFDLVGVLQILGIGVNVVIVVIGIVWAIPSLGLPGVLWTIFAGFIAVSNLRRLLAGR
jgi:hypothetical protein